MSQMVPLRKGRRRNISWGRESKGFDFECDVCDFQFLQKNLNLKNERDINDVYEIQDKLGAGTFGTVRVGVHKTTQQRRAIKNIFKGHTTKSEEAQLANEMSILQKISHTNILPMIEYFETNTRVYIVTDIYEGGELFDEIIARGDFDENSAATVVSQLISCIDYLSSKKIIHRDLKPENILLTKTKDLEAIKLIDFGHAIEFDPETDEPLTKRVGTPYYIAPEILNGKYDNRVDLWSVGVITYILLSGSPPFGGHDNDEIFERVATGDYSMKFDPWPQVSETAKDFVNKILKVDPDKRKPLDEMQHHPFLQMKDRLPSKRLSAVKQKKPNALKRLSRNVASGMNQSFDKAKKLLTQRSLRKKETQAVKNLKTFKCKLKIAQVVHAYVVTQCLPKKTREDLAQVFRSWDKNNDGFLSKEEMVKGITKAAPKVAKVFDLEDWFRTMDSDHNGFIEYHEFLIMATDVRLMSKKNLLAVFDFLDKDNSGFLEVDELRLALDDVDDVEGAVQEMLQEADANGDGKISKEEFLNLLSTS